MGSGYMDADHGPCLQSEEYLKERIAELEAKIQFLINIWPKPLEDGGMTFPDGDFWEATTDDGPAGRGGGE